MKKPDHLHVNIGYDPNKDELIVSWSNGWIALDIWDRIDYVDKVIVRLENHTRMLNEQACGEAGIDLPVPRKKRKHK